MQKKGKKLKPNFQMELHIDEGRAETHKFRMGLKQTIVLLGGLLHRRLF